MADPLERLTNLVALLLEARQPLTLEQIADALAGQYPEGKAARRGAFERDKAILREGGVPIESQVLSGDAAGATGYFIDRRRYELRLDLTPEESRAPQMVEEPPKEEEKSDGKKSKKRSKGQGELF